MTDLIETKSIVYSAAKITDVWYGVMVNHVSYAVPYSEFATFDNRKLYPLTRAQAFRMADLLNSGELEAGEVESVLLEARMEPRKVLEVGCV